MELVFLALLIVLMATALGSGFPVAFALPGSAILAIGIPVWIYVAFIAKEPVFSIESDVRKRNPTTTRCATSLRRVAPATARPASSRRSWIKEKA